MSSTPEHSEVKSSPQQAKTAPFKDVRHYVLWWMVWIGAVSFFTYTDASGSNFWIAKAYQTAWALLFAAACAVVFTLLQNSANQKRSKVLSWVFAIGVFLALKFLIAAVFPQQ